jgi:DNA polymerase-1
MRDEDGGPPVRVAVDRLSEVLQLGSRTFAWGHTREPWVVEDWILKQLAAAGTPWIVLGLDVETTGLDMYADDFKIRTVQLATEDEAWVMHVDYSTWTRDGVAGLLKDARLRFVTHSQFDAQCLLAELGVDITGRTLDSHLLARLVAPSDDEEHGLKPLCKKWLLGPQLEEKEAALHAQFKKLAQERELRKLAVSKLKLAGWGFQEIDTEDRVFLEYAAMDAVACRRLAPELVRVLGTGRNLVEMEMWLWDQAVHMRHRGMQLDGKTVTELRDTVAEEMEISERYVETATGGIRARSVKLVDWLVDHGVRFTDDERTVAGAPSLSKAHLDAIIARSEGDVEAQQVLQHKQKVSQLANDLANLEGFIALSDDEWRVHPELNTLRARTARMSVTRPALQTLKKKGDLRDCFIAAPGMVMVSCDFAQIELRVAAALSGDHALTKPILEGRDLHDDTAERIFGTHFDAEQRAIAKMANFLSVYGGGAKTLAVQAGIDLGMAKMVVGKWKTAYPHLVALAQSLSTRSEVVTPTGRRLPIDPERPYSALNYLIQSTSRDLLVIALRRVVDNLGMAENVQLLVHDEILLQIPEHTAEAQVAAVKEQMATTLYGVPIEADAEILGARWAS